MTEHLKITPKIPRKRYVADGAQTAFSFDFVLFQPGELLVTVNGAPVGAGVVVSLLADGTGTAAFAAAPVADAVVVLQRRLTIKRETDFQEGGELRAKTLNDEFDFQTAALQQVETAAARALQLPVDDADNAGCVLPTAAVRATKMLAFDASGNPVLSNRTLAQMEDGSSAAAASAAAAASDAAAAEAAATAADAAATNARNAASAAKAIAASLALPLPLASGGTGAATAVAARANLGLGSAATLAAGTAANQVPQLDGLGRMPAVDGSQLTNLAGSSMQIAAGEALADRDLVYQDVFNQRGGGNERWYKVDADAVSPVRISPRIGIALAAIASGASGPAQIRTGTVAGFAGLLPGLLVYASATAGAVTQTAPTIPANGAQNAAREIGTALNATAIDFKPHERTVFTGRNPSLAVDGMITLQHWSDAGARERDQAAYLVQTSSTVTTGTFAAATVSTRLVDTVNGVLGFQFAATATGTLANVRVDVQSVAASGSWSARLLANNAGCPGTQVGAPSNALTISGAGVATFTFASPPSIALGTTYWLVVAPISGAPSITLNVTGNQAGYGSGRNNTIAAITDNGFGASEDWRVEINQSTAARDEPLTIGGSIANAAATDRVNVRYDDGSGGNADTRTTFINRTGAVRDMAVEVVL